MPASKQPPAPRPAAPAAASVLPATPIPGTNEAMLQMLHMMQAMLGLQAVPAPAADPAAVPFHTDVSPAPAEGAPAAPGIVRPGTIAGARRVQQPLPTGTILDRLCLDESGGRALGGLPRGCLCALAGPPGKGKMRTALAALARVVKAGVPSVLVVGDESLADGGTSNRDDLATRLARAGAAATRTSEAEFTAQVLDRLFVLESRWDRADRMWDAFIQRYRYVVESLGARFALIDAGSLLDADRTTAADNLSALKTYNHEHGVTCLLVGQIRESTGLPVGGAGLLHTCDTVYILEELSLGSKEMAEHWGGAYREKIDLLACSKSVTTPVFPYPVRVERNPERGTLSLSGMNPVSHTPPDAAE